MLSPIVGVSGSPSASATQYSSISTAESSSTFNSTESVVLHDMPVAAILSTLYVEVATAPGAGKSFAFAVMKNSVATGLTVTISDANTSATDSVNTASFSAGDTISFRSVPSGTPTVPGTLWWNLVCEATGQPLFASSNGNTASATNIGIMSRSPNATAANIESVVPVTGVFSNLYVRVNNAPVGATSKIFTLLKDGVATPLTATIAGAATTANDTSNTSSFSATNRACMEVAISGAPVSSTALHSVLFTPTVAGDCFLGFGVDANVSTLVANFMWLQGTSTSYSGTEANRRLILGNWTIASLQAKTVTASGAGNSYAIVVRKNAADTALTVSLANTTTVQSITGTVDVVNGDKLVIGSTPSGTPSNSRLNTGVRIIPTSAPSVSTTPGWNQSKGGWH